MKITGLFLALMMMASVCFAQQTATVYSRVVTGSVSGVIPETDGIDNISLQKSANRVLNNAADNLAKQLGSCRLSYTVTLNRPTVVGILLKAENGANTVYKGVNIDLTTGREMALTEIFRGGETFTNITGPYNDALLYEEACISAIQKAQPIRALCRIKICCQQSAQPKP